MIISGGSRSNAKFFARHLLNAHDNECVEIGEIRGLTSDSIPEALREMDAIASGTRCKNFFYHADINPQPGEVLTGPQWDIAVDTLERNLGYDGHARFVIEHSKGDRIHRHVVWSRIDPDTMTAVSDSFNYKAHERTSRELEELFGHDPVASTLTRDTDVKRPDRRPENWEVFRGSRSKISPEDVKLEVTGLWNASDSGSAFAAGLEEHGYMLCKGDKRDFVILDAAGDSHSLARRIDGAKAATVRARMADVGRDQLPSVEEGRVLLSERRQAAVDVAKAGAGPADALPKPAAPVVAEHVLEGGIEAADDTPAPLWTIDDIRDANAAAQPPQGRTIRERIAAYAGPINDAFSRGEDLPTHDGLTWFERMHTVLSSTMEVVGDWARERFQSFVAMVHDRRADTPGRSGPDEPDMGG